MHDESNDPSYVPTPTETPGTSRVATRDSQSSYSQPTKSHSPYEGAPASITPASPPSSRGSPEEKPHQVKFTISDEAEDSLPHTPVARPLGPDPNDPYRRSRRLPQTTNLAEIPDRFHFEKVTKKRQSQQYATTAHHHHSGGMRHKLGSKSLKDHFRSSGYDSSGEEDHTGSQVSLRRFFRGGGKEKKPSRPSTPSSPTTSTPARSATPPPTQKRKSSEKKISTMPFGDDHAGLGLTERYGKFGKVLGAGAGGSVRLMKRTSDGTTFAVKEFRARQEHETQREYAKKVNAEFTIGSILSHQNIIETLDIVNEGGRYFEVMEYCRYDLVFLTLCLLIRVCDCDDWETN